MDDEDYTPETNKRKNDSSEEEPVKRQKVSDPVNFLRAIVEKIKDEDSDSEELSDYFENDYTEIKDTIIEHVLDNLSKNQRGALEKKIRQGVESAFELLDELLEESFVGLVTHKPTSNMWKLGLGPRDIKKYKKELEYLQKPVKVSIKKILDANIPKEKKQKLLEYYNTLQNVDKYSLEYKIIASQINAVVDTKSNPQEEKLKTIVKQNVSLKSRILNADMDDKRKAVIYDRYLQLQKNPDDSITRAQIEEWIEEALKTPFTKVTDTFDSENPGKQLIKLRNSFEEHLSEMDTVLEPLLTIFNNKMHNPDSGSMVIGLLGSPGLGKTAVGKVIADAWGLPFQQISLGGVIDSSILDGQHPGWVGSKPGRFAQALQEMGAINGVLFLDEIDKLGNTQHGLQVQYSLLHSIDPTQNSQYTDHYLGSQLPLDLSKCLIICAMNKVEGLDPALLNRMNIIHVPDYTPTQKTSIMTTHLFPQAMKNAGLTDEITLSSDICGYMQERVEKNIGKEGGVRGVRNCLSIIIDKLALLIRLSAKERKKLNLSFAIDKQPPIDITREIVDEFYPIKKSSAPSHLHIYM